jgi:tRNA(Phe) wybutosine-synthesizing methylase Tyw3
LLWLKVEGFILHVACRNIEKATDLLQKVRDSGFKRSGIISAGNKIMIEIKDDNVELLHKNGIEKLEVIQRYSTELMLLKELI